MNCRDFIIEFEERRELSGAAQLHANDCPGCRKTTVVQARIWETIDDFPTVSAPPTFDFRVKARIANARPTDFQPKFLPVLRYVLPLAAIVLVFGLLISNTSLFFGNNNNETQVAAVIPASAKPAETAPDSFIAPDTTIADSSVLPAPPVERFTINNANQTAKAVSDKQETEFAVFKSARKSAAAPRRQTVKDNSEGGGSNDKALTDTPVLLPEGIKLNQPREDSPNAVTPSGAVGEEIWAFVGIEIVSENGNRIVKAVKQNSLAARRHLKVGDVITEIDGVKLSAAPFNQQKFEIKSLTVTRGTEKVEISLNDK